MNTANGAANLLDSIDFGDVPQKPITFDELDAELTHVVNAIRLPDPQDDIGLMDLLGNMRPEQIDRLATQLWSKAQALLAFSTLMREVSGATALYRNSCRDAYALVDAASQRQLKTAQAQQERQTKLEAFRHAVASGEVDDDVLLRITPDDICDGLPF